MLRPATLSDLADIVGFAEQHAEKYPYLQPNGDKIKKLITMAISSASSFAYVDDTDGKVTGALVGLTNENMWANKHNCQIVVWRSDRNGAGRELLRKFKTWIEPRRAIRIAGVVFDFDTRKGVKHLLEQNGFSKHGGAYLWHRGFTNGTV